MRLPLFPLDGGWRLAAKVTADPRNLRDGVDDLPGNPVEEAIRRRGAVSCNKVIALHGSQDHNTAIMPGIALDAD